DAVVGRVPEDAARPGLGVVLVPPGQQRADHRPQVAALAGQRVLVVAVRAGLGRGPPPSIQALKRVGSTARGISRWTAKSPNRRTPKKASRTMSSVHRSPTTS